MCLTAGVGKTTLFCGKRDHEAFQRCLLETIEKGPMRVLAYCVMSSHWHLVLWPKQDGDLAKFMLTLTISHIRRWLIHRGEVGAGHVYQGRYKSFAVQDDDHLATVCRYVERNPVRSKLRLNNRLPLLPCRWTCLIHPGKHANSAILEKMGFIYRSRSLEFEV